MFHEFHAASHEDDLIGIYPGHVAGKSREYVSWMILFWGTNKWDIIIGIIKGSFVGKLPNYGRLFDCHG